MTETLNLPALRAIAQAATQGESFPKGVERFTPCLDYRHDASNEREARMQSSDDGAWVLYGDFCALITRAEKAEAALVEAERAAIEAYEREAWIRVEDAPASMTECLVGTHQTVVKGHVSHLPGGTKVAGAPGYHGFEWPYCRPLPHPPRSA